MRQVKWFVTDVDGTLTDGGLYFGADGELMKRFHVRDGYGFTHLLPKMGIIPVILTGRKSQIVAARARELRIDLVFQGAVDKLSTLCEQASSHNIPPCEIAYIGDDLPDIPCIDYCGVTACPSDSPEEVKAHVDYVCRLPGGLGCVREFIEYLCKIEDA